MTNELTLREKIELAMRNNVGICYDALEVDYDGFASDLCDALEDTGSPAHMRVAAELRGE